MINRGNIASCGMKTPVQLLKNNGKLQKPEEEKTVSYPRRNFGQDAESSYHPLGPGSL